MYVTIEIYRYTVCGVGFNWDFGVNIIVSTCQPYSYKVSTLATRVEICKYG